MTGTENWEASGKAGLDVRRRRRRREAGLNSDDTVLWKEYYVMPMASNPVGTMNNIVVESAKALSAEEDGSGSVSAAAQAADTRRQQPSNEVRRRPVRFAPE